ncbi:MAG: hypothetical protein IJJ06_09490 [Mogibacterium sp.]|nr:hypothetical protein [Mogibacterium sp.]
MSRSSAAYMGKHSADDAGVRIRDGEKDARWYNWLISLAVNAVILAAVLYFTDLMYETNDDFAIAEKLAAGYPYVGFVNYYLCRALMAVQAAFPAVNSFTISQLAASFVSFTVLFKVMLDRNAYFIELLLGAVVTAFFSLDHYSSMQFTKTSGLLMTAGLILVVDTYINNRGHRLRFFIYSIIGYALFFAGVAYRQKGMFPALAYAGVFMFLWLILSGREYFRGRRPVPETVLIIVLLAAAVVPYGIDLKSDAVNAGTAELALGREYQAERVKITDYPMIENYEEHKTQYDEIGLSENDLYLIDRWIFDYDGAASLENLKKINEINYPGVLESRSVTRSVKKFLKNSYKAVKGLDFTGMHILILAVLALYFISAVSPRNWFYAVFTGLLTAGIYVAVYYISRPQYRAFYVADIGAAFWILFALSIIPKRNTKYFRVLTCVAAACVVGMLFTPALGSLESQRAHIEKQIEPAAITEYFAAHTDNFYIGPTTAMKQPASYLDPLEVPVPAPNVSGTGGWETMTPYKLDFLANYGISNPVRDLVDTPDTYFFGDSKKGKLREYLNKWYGGEGKEIIFEKVDEVSGNGVYRVITTEY